MPETIDPPIVPAAPAAEVSAPKVTGIDALMAQLDAADAAASPGAAPAPAKVEPEAAAAPAAKPQRTEPNDPLKPAVKPAPVKPEEDMSVEDMEKFLKAHSNKKPWKIYESLKTTTAQKVADLEGKLSALEKKPVESPGDAAKMAALEKQIEALTGETKTYKEKLAQADFHHTDAYQNLSNKATRLFQQGATAIAALQITNPDGDTRAATAQDLDRLRRMDPIDREDKIEELFGPKARIVARFTDALDAVRSEANDAEEDYAKSHEQTSVQRELESKGQRAKFDNAYKVSLENLQKNEVYGKWFKPDAADPEASKLLTDGFSEIEKAITQSEQMSPEDSAAYAAVFRARSAAMPRMLLEVNRLNAKTKALEAELATYRSTDPGARGATGGGGTTGENKPKGIEGMALQFDSDPSLVR
jgi:hypothetical protein